MTKSDLVFENWNGIRFKKLWESDEEIYIMLQQGEVE